MDITFSVLLLTALCLAESAIVPSKKVCVTDCVYSPEHRFNICYVDEYEWKYCNLQDHFGKDGDRRLTDLMRTLIPKRYQHSDSIHTHAVAKRQISYSKTDALTPGSISRYIANLATANHAQLVFYNQPTRSGIYRYAYLNPVNSRDPTLPLLISAKIYQNTLPRQGTREPNMPSAIKTNVKRMGKNTGRADGNNDENGHLIAWENGGPFDVYNFAPQPKSLNLGQVSGLPTQRQSEWKRMENSINSWVRGGQGYVNQTVVVVYDTQNGVMNPRPVGFALNVAYYYTNNQLRYESHDYYSNNPTDEPTAEPVSDYPPVAG